MRNMFLAKQLSLQTKKLVFILKFNDHVKVMKRFAPYIISLVLQTHSFDIQLCNQFICDSDDGCKMQQVSSLIIQISMILPSCGV